MRAQQTDTQSPYSFYGLGAISQNPLQNGMAMGGIFNGLRDSTSLNFLNPASYAGIDVTQLSFGFEFNLLNTSNQTHNNLFINQLGLGIPLMNRKNFGWGMYFGFSPYSQIGYSFRDTSEVILGPDTVTQRNEYTGDGGLNKLTLGTGFRIGRHFSFGGNVHYLFGVSDRNRSLVLPVADDFLSARVQEKTTVNAVLADFGAQYFGQFKVISRKRPQVPKDSLPNRSRWPVQEKNYHFCVGATYNLGYTFGADFDQLGIQYFSGSVQTGIDTFLLTPTTRQTVTVPHRFGAGFTISNPDIWTVGADFNYATWSQFTYFDQPTTQYSDSWSISAGVEFLPPYRNRNSGKAQFFKNFVYRAGARYHSRPLRPDGNPVDEFGFSFGLGLPFGFKKVYNENLDVKNILSYLNIGVEGGFARSQNAGIINETFFRLNVGLSLRDKWFTKRRFN